MALTIAKISNKLYKTLSFSVHALFVETKSQVSTTAYFHVKVAKHSLKELCKTKRIISVYEVHSVQYR